MSRQFKSALKQKIKMSNDTLNMLIKLKNGQLVKKSFVFQRKSLFCSKILNVLWDEGYILGYKNSDINSNMFEIFLKYNHNQPAIKFIKFISKPSKRIYVNSKQLFKINLDLGLFIISTNKGTFSLQNCKKLRIGGEPLAVIC